MKQNKDVRLTMRLTPEQYESICARAETAQMTPSAYARAAAMRHKVTVVPGLKELTHELKAIGRNINQLTVLAHEGRVQVATAMSRTLRYVKRNDKTRDKQFVSGWNCTPRLAEEEFLATRQAHRKSGGRWFYHYTQSFSPKENVMPELAQAPDEVRSLDARNVPTDAGGDISVHRSDPALQAPPHRAGEYAH